MTTRARIEALIAPAVARSKAVEEIVVGNGVTAEAATLYRRHFGEGPALIVADENTWRAAGEAVAGVLRDSGLSVRSHILPASPRPKPSVELGREILGALGDATAVSVGSGVVNDVTKWAAFEAGRPYLCVATAASMDGYSSAGAPLSEAGFKKTIPTRAPKAILADLDVVAAAPPEMSGWGYGDLAGKVPAGGDWIVADALGVEPIDTVAWPLVQDNLDAWLASPKAVRRGDPDAIADLFAGLTLSGLAMEFHDSSRPASGADHQIAHLWEMEGLEHDGERVSHGACVSIGCLAVLGLYDWLLTRDLTRLDADTILASAPSLDTKLAEIDALLSPEIAGRAKDETRAKHLGPEAHRARIEAVKARWPQLKARLTTHMRRADAMRASLEQAGAPVTAAQIGVSQARLSFTIRASRFIRSRYTVLDLLDECGLLDAAVTATVAPPERAA
ncbi:MAG: sn-glycerol-1-phosphate dehydrogenase [Pseudomonadota bacterium]